MQQWGLLVTGEAKANAARVFKKNTQGGLRQTIHFSQPSNASVILRVPKPYAAIHEYGGKTKPHEIRPRRKGGVLRFVLPNGTVVFARSVQHPGSKIKEKRYLRDAIDSKRAEGEAALARELMKAAQQ
jgi:phage gpG-like protein